MQLTPEQQQIVESIVPHADKLARKLCPGDDEARSVAYLALCEAVDKDPALETASIKTYCLRYARRALNNYIAEKSGRRRKDGGRKGSVREYIHNPDGIVSKSDGGVERVEMDDLLSVLDPLDREIFVQKFLHEEPDAVLLERYGWTRWQIYSACKRCKERLRREIDGDSCSNTSSRV